MMEYRIGNEDTISSKLKLLLLNSSATSYIQASKVRPPKVGKLAPTHLAGRHIQGIKSTPYLKISGIPKILASVLKINPAIFALQ